MYILLLPHVFGYTYLHRDKSMLPNTEMLRLKKSCNSVATIIPDSPNRYLYLSLPPIDRLCTHTYSHFRHLHRWPRHTDRCSIDGCTDCVDTQINQVLTFKYTSVWTARHTIFTLSQTYHLCVELKSLNPWTDHLNSYKSYTKKQKDCIVALQSVT